MGLVTKEVEINISGSTQKYYENLGYEIPRRKKNGRMSVQRNAKIIIKTEDLSEKSNIHVDVECDGCKKILNLKYLVYIKYRHGVSYYCHSCSPKIFNSGENNPSWNPNKTDEEREHGRKIPEYNIFIRKVLKRDKYTCQCCGQEHGDLEVHHLDGYDWYIEGRTDETNGICLCSTCHKAFHSKFGYGGNTKKQYEEWIGYAIGELERYNGILLTTKQVYDYERDEFFDSAKTYAKTFNVGVSEVRRCCNHDIRTKKRKDKNGIVKIEQYRINTVKGHHLFWLDEYVQMSEEEIFEFIENSSSKLCRKNICITTGEIFKTLKQSSDKYDISMSAICQCCNNEKNSAGKLPDGTPLKWMYYEDFLKLPVEEQNKILSRNQEPSTDGSFIM